MNSHFEPNISLLDDGISNFLGIKPKAERKAKKAARKEKRATKKAARHEKKALKKASKHGGISSPVETESVDSTSTNIESVATTPSLPNADNSVSVSKSGSPASSEKVDVSDNSNNTSDDKILGMPKMVAYGVGAVVGAAILFFGFKMIKGKPVPVA